MTASPTLAAGGEPAASDPLAPGAAGSATPETLPADSNRSSAAADGWNGELRERLELAATRAGVGVAALCDLWIQEGLERAESQAAAEAAGRCSLRTGTCTVGPVPLPVQQ